MKADPVWADGLADARQPPGTQDVRRARRLGGLRRGLVQQSPRGGGGWRDGRTVRPMESLAVCGGGVGLGLVSRPRMGAPRSCGGPCSAGWRPISRAGRAAGTLLRHSLGSSTVLWPKPPPPDPDAHDTGGHPGGAWKSLHGAAHLGGHAGRRCSGGASAPSAEQHRGDAIA
jgi:hypothetical protein